MFQNFESRSEREQSPTRIVALRERMKSLGIGAFLVPHADEHQNEYLPASAERLAWLTGFTGSAGFAIVTTDRAVLFVDGRYTLQAADQTDPAVISIESLIDTPPSTWLAANAKKGTRIGFDPWLTTLSERKRFDKAAAKAGAELISVENPVDTIWRDRPATPAGPAYLHPLLHAGKPAVEKIADIAEAIRKAGADWHVVVSLVSLAWLFNLRGGDIAHIPLAFGFALVPSEGRPLLFLARHRLDRATLDELSAIVELREPGSLLEGIRDLAKGRKFLCDPDTVSVAVASAIAEAGGEVIEGSDPCALPRATKNEAEIAGSRAAHLRDGVAMVRFLAWLDRQKPGTVDEIGAASRLEEFRASAAREMNSELREVSFDTISGAGANGAIVHYRVTEATNRAIEDNSLYLVDSGGQYVDGTTDITRTVAIGLPPAGAVDDFILVLKGHIAIATTRFPAGTRGMDIDAFARRSLWQVGKDYAHGTGHGVGSFLSVHEGPAAISRRGTEPLKAGMILSNEPGFYRQGLYGIRIENLILVRETADYPGFLEFETLTLSPVDRRLINPAALSPDERRWLNAYHARVLEALSPHLEATDRTWLEVACAPLTA